MWRCCSAGFIVELDGRHHGKRVQAKKDQRRNNMSVVRGFSVLRYYYDATATTAATVPPTAAGASSSGAG